MKYSFIFFTISQITMNLSSNEIIIYTLCKTVISFSIKSGDTAEKILDELNSEHLYFKNKDYLENILKAFLKPNTRYIKIMNQNL